MNESNSLITNKNGKILKKNKKRNFVINIKKTFIKVKEKSLLPYLLAILICIIIILIGVLIVSIWNEPNKKKNKLSHLNWKHFKQNLNYTINEPKLKFDNITETEFISNFVENNKQENKNYFISKFKKEYKPPKNQNPSCDNLDPIKLFKARLNSPFKTICKESKSQHICTLNKNPMYSGPNGVICKMSNIILDPTKWQNSSYIYKGPVDVDKKGKPILSQGFFNMKCKNPSFLEGYNNMYKPYFNGWDYNFTDNINNKKYEELAPGKTVFFLSRNQDSPNLYHGGSEFINALSLMYLLNLEPEDIQVIFLESITIYDDPFYTLYEKLIGRGGKPIYMRNLDMTKKYYITNAVHIPINWDSPCFISSGVPYCKKPTLTYYFYNKLIDNYLNISDYFDPFQSDGEIFYYPKQVLESYKSNIKFKKVVTFQWRRIWPKGRKNQQRILGNGPELVDKLASVLPKDFLIRLIDTASLPIEEQISIMRKTDYFIGMHGAGLMLSIFAPSHCIFHEILPRYNMNGLLLMASLSGHKTYSEILPSTEQIIDTNEMFYFNVDVVADKVLGHMKEKNFFN